MAPRFRGANNQNYQALIWHHKIFSPIKFLSGDLTTPVAGRPPGGFAIFPLPHPSYASSLRNFALISAWLCRRLRFHPSVTQVTIQEDLLRFQVTELKIVGFFTDCLCTSLTITASSTSEIFGLNRKCGKGGGGIVYSRYAKNGSSINIMNNWKNYPFNVDMVINEYTKPLTENMWLMQHYADT
ncbi:hypothetical protein LXL04_022603 [Taraxacum kok-saghyz]